MPFIANLHGDILLHVFHLNTQRDEIEGTEYSMDILEYPKQDPIVEARRASQVCRSWRQLVLGSPAIWGSLINPLMASRGSTEWVDLVMERTGNADLSIYGHFNTACFTRSASHFLKSLMLRQWHRVRTIDITLSPSSLNDFIPLMQLVWSKPAPILERFLLRIYPFRVGNLKDSSLIGLGSSQFSNSAPSLRRFHCQFLSPKANWIPQLSSVTVSNPLTTSEVLKLLSNAIRLDSLVIAGTIYDPQAIDWTHPIHLPKLRLIHLRDCAAPDVLVYLEKIVTMPECVLQLEVTNYEHVITERDLGLLFKAAEPYVQSYFSTYRPYRLSMTVIPINKFVLESNTFTEMHYIGHPKLIIDIETTTYRDGELWPEINIIHARPVYDALLSSLRAETITEYHLDTPDSWIKSDDPDFVNLILSLSSVKTLGMSGHSFEILNNIPLTSGCPVHFPKLTRVELFSGGVKQDALIQFFSRRQTVHFDNYTLDVSRTFSFYYNNRNWHLYYTFLKRFNGLKVVWTAEERREDFNGEHTILTTEEIRGQYVPRSRQAKKKGKSQSFSQRTLSSTYWK